MRRLFSDCISWLWELTREPGGILVLVGVVGESVFEWCNWPSNEERRKRLKRTFGLILILGLVLEMPESARLRKLASENEVQVALLTRTNLVLRSNVLALEIQLEQIRTNVANMDPITGPVRTVEAHVFFALVKPVVAKNHNGGMKCALLRLGEPYFRQSNGPVVIDLFTEQFHEQMTDGEQKFTLDFRLTPDEPGFGGRVIDFGRGVPAGSAVNGLSGFGLDVWFLPTDAEVVRGFIALKINSVLEKHFDIPRQKLGLPPQLVSPVELKIPVEVH